MFSKSWAFCFNVNIHTKNKHVTLAKPFEGMTIKGSKFSNVNIGKGHEQIQVT
jgi:hypothetical protein